MRPVFRLSSSHSIERVLACIMALWPGLAILAHAQASGLNLGPDTNFARLDFTQKYLDGQNAQKNRSELERAQQKQLVDSGVVSALDLAAPNKAVGEFNRAASLMKAQNSKEAIIHLQKALSIYPRLVSAHVNLGLAYLDQGDNERAKTEFETAAQCDGKFSDAFLNLGLLSLSQKDFAAAQSQLEQAASLQPRSPRILSSLVYAQNERRQYRRALETAQRVHALEHKGMANVHYVAASAAMALNDFETMRRELSIFVGEDPTNALAPIARQNLELLARNAATVEIASSGGSTSPAPVIAQTSYRVTGGERLKAQLSELGDSSGAGPCQNCVAAPEPSVEVDSRILAPDIAARFSGATANSWTIRKNVDEVALSFAVSRRGRMVSDLAPSDIQIRDDDKPPERVLQFTPQSRLPLRMALLVDTSGSVHDRFSFERQAAAKFVQQLLNGTSDLGFVAGFSSEITVTQDFSADPARLATGIQRLTNGGGTVLFDAVSFACSKLAEYPDRELVARVLVVLSDGEDTSSRNSLKQVIQDAETSGVTIYTVSTRDQAGLKTTQDKILQALADRSGGEATFPLDTITLGRVFTKLHDLIRSRYLVAYKPADFMPNGKYRTIKITAERNGKPLQVRARKGYYARLEPTSE